MPDKNTEVLATYDNQFYKGKAAVVKRKVGKGSVTYIGVDTDDSKLGKRYITGNLYQCRRLPPTIIPKVFMCIGGMDFMLL